MSGLNPKSWLKGFYPGNLVKILTYEELKVGGEPIVGAKNLAGRSTVITRVFDDGLVTLSIDGGKNHWPKSLLCLVG